MCKNKNKEQIKKRNVKTAKECSFLAVFVALVIAIQLAFSLVPGVELVTVLFVCYAFVMGEKRGMIAATLFSVLRQFVFGVYPTVLVLYLLYYNLLSLCFGLLGKKVKNPIRQLPLIVSVACICTICFTLIDNILTPLWYGYSRRATRAYFYASLPFMVPQVICTAVSVACLFFPVWKTFSLLKRRL